MPRTYAVAHHPRNQASLSFAEFVQAKENYSRALPIRWAYVRPFLEACRPSSCPATYQARSKPPTSPRSAPGSNYGLHSYLTGLSRGKEEAWTTYTDPGPRLALQSFPCFHRSARGHKGLLDIESAHIDVARASQPAPVP